ncbi:hypothetical protein [Frankia sp. CiP3]|uniref:hypothetical protein n=1 Tax=Frankia sp. CiP3 TaxID=2880971 RepID=UPI001EF57217|nr:hypothetical protein [Frankia sp. CiP3]
MARHAALAAACGTPTAEVTVVFDAGQNSTDNVAHLAGLAASGLHFVGSVPPSDCADLLALPTKKRNVVDAARFGGLTALDTRRKVYSPEAGGPRRPAADADGAGVLRVSRGRSTVSDCPFADCSTVGPGPSKVSGCSDAGRLWRRGVECGLGVAAQLRDKGSCSARADVQAFAEVLGGDRAVMKLPMENVLGACAVEQVLLPCARSVSARCRLV